MLSALSYFLPRKLPKPTWGHADVGEFATAPLSTLAKVKTKEPPSPAYSPILPFFCLFLSLLRNRYASQSPQMRGVG